MSGLANLYMRGGGRKDGGWGCMLILVQRKIEYHTPKRDAITLIYASRDPMEMAPKHLFYDIEKQANNKKVNKF